jgi:ABC-type amino acid transport substrate-binding protein
MKKILLAVALAAWCLPAKAQSVIKFQEEVDWAPFTPSTPGKTTKGLSYELMSAIFAKLDTKVELEVLPFARVLDDAKSGSIDGITTISPNKEREAFLAFSVPTIPKRGYIYYKADRQGGLKWNSYEDLKGMSFGIVTGNSYSPEFDAAVKAGTIKAVAVPTLDLLPKMVMAGRIDGFLVPSIVGNKLLADQGLTGKLVPTARPYVDQNFSLAISKKSPFAAKLSQINQAIQSMQRDGSFKQILAKYGI